MVIQRAIPASMYEKPCTGWSGDQINFRDGWSRVVLTVVTQVVQQRATETYWRAHRCYSRRVVGEFRCGQALKVDTGER